MALKRKRGSPSEFPSSPSNTSNLSVDSPLGQFYHQSKPTPPVYQEKPTWGFPTYSSPPPEDRSDLISRTRKRHRDNRPEEGEVYASTMQKLYDAQRVRHAPQTAQPQPPPSSAAEQPNEQSVSQPQRSNLHSFWHIPRPPPSHVPSHMAMDPGPVLRNLEPRCEDCVGPLRYSDAMDIEGDVQQHDSSCVNCSRQICDGCTIMATERMCLLCARSMGYSG